MFKVQMCIQKSEILHVRQRHIIFSVSVAGLPSYIHHDPNKKKILQGESPKYFHFVIVCILNFHRHDREPKIFEITATLSNNETHYYTRSLQDQQSREFGDII